MEFKLGDRVAVVERDATEEDIKSGLYYNHFRGMSGSVQKIFESTGDIAVTVDFGSLSEPIMTRHMDVREAMKTKWLEGLSEDARSRLTDAEKDFLLRYSILVAPKDLAISDKPAPEQTNSGALPAPEAAEELTPRRKTAAEIEADEAAYLESRKREEQG